MVCAWALVLPLAAWGRRHDFPLIGVGLDLPKTYAVRRIDRQRVVLAGDKVKTQVAVYRVELGTQAHDDAFDQKLTRALTVRLGPKARIKLRTINIGQRPGQRLDVLGQRQAKPWTMSAVWTVRGGQAIVVEVLSPAKSPAGPVLDGLLQKLRWLDLDRG